MDRPRGWRAGLEASHVNGRIVREPSSGAINPLCTIALSLFYSGTDVISK